MRAQQPRFNEWECAYCNRLVPPSVYHKCLEYDRAMDDDEMVDPKFECFIEPLPEIRIPLIFCDSADRRQRLTLLADFLEKSGGRVAVQNASLLVADLRALAASGMEARQGGNEVPSRSDDSPTAESGDAQ